MRRIAASEIENTPLQEEILIFKLSNSRDCCWGVIVVSGIEIFGLRSQAQKFCEYNKNKTTTPLQKNLR